MNKSEKKHKKQKKREKLLKSRKPGELNPEITRDDRKFGKFQILVLLAFVLALIIFIISKTQ